jgi:hypothetical protein
MQRYNTKTRLGSYTITTQLIKKITDFLSHTLPKMLSSDLSYMPAEESTALTIIYSDHAVRYPHIREYQDAPFKGEIQGLQLELSHLIKFFDATKAIVVNLSFNKEKEDNYLYMALQDDMAEKELPAIESTLLSLLEQYKNNHHLIYRSQWLTPIIFLTGGLFGSLTFLTHTQPMRSLYAMLFGVSIYLFVFPYINGYSTFDSSRQKNWNLFFRWFTASVAVSVLAIMLF